MRSLIIHGTRNFEYHSYLENMYSQIQRQFTEEKKWTLHAKPSLRVDHYDTENTIYFVTFGKQGSVEASIRLNPTLRASMLADHFQHLIETGDKPRADDVYEISRFIVQPRFQYRLQTRDALREAKARLLALLMEWSLEQRAAFLQTVIDVRNLASYVEITPQTRVLGLAHPYGETPDSPDSGECIALRWPVTTGVLHDVKTYGDSSNRRPSFHTATGLHLENEFTLRPERFRSRGSENPSDDR